MEQYLRRNRLSEVLDGIGIRALLYGVALMWFVWLWGLGMPALLAGLALGTLMQLARSRRRRRSVQRREKALRCRLGAELMLEEMLLSGAGEAHRRAAQLLGQRWSLTTLESSEDGVLCRCGDEKLLITCLRIPPESEWGMGDLAAAQRAVRKCGADRGVMCVLGRTSARALVKAEQTPVPLRIIRRETLLALAGRMAPATDEQLVALGKRRRRPAGKESVIALILRRDKARRYYVYGLLMTVMYVLTGVRVYAVPGMLCLTMAVLCRSGFGGEEPL